MKTNFKLGERTSDVWAGDIVTICEYIANIGQGRMLFWDINNKCFRRVFIELYSDGTPILNGWDCATCPSKLL